MMFSFFKPKKRTVVVEEEQIEEEFDDVTPIAHYIKNITGIDFSEQLAILKNKASNFSRRHELYSFDACLNRLKHSKEFEQEFIDYLTTNESFFYREFAQISTLVKAVQSTSSPVRILCAPSANGEEPYSIAIALIEGGISPQRFSITGIDISTEAIEQAKKAIYTAKSVRNLNDTLLAKYFDINDNKYHLKQLIKECVSFVHINIFDPQFSKLGKYDYIFSRNLFIYFDKPTKLRAQEILGSMLKDPDQTIFYGHADLI